MPLAPLPFSGPTVVPGFVFSGISAGIKKKPDTLDLGLILSHSSARCAALFTTNRVQAAPVLLGKERVAKGTCRAILINSGNANACTGETGYQDAIQMTKLLAQNLKISEQEVLVSSTGVIGRPLPMDKIEMGIAPLVAAAKKENLFLTSKAIHTTDTFDKIFGKTFEIDGKKVTLCGITKGAGMIQPQMATMLAFLMTDAAVSSEMLQKALREATEDTFNAITVDGEMSTNDSIFLMANGEAKNSEIKSAGASYQTFLQGLRETCDFLARQIMRDGEGVTKFVELKVTGLKDSAHLKTVALAMANSYLVRTAIHGQDANWGRILSAAGACASRIGIQDDFAKASIAFNDVFVLKDGVGQGEEAEKRAHDVMTGDEFQIKVILNPAHSQTWKKIYTSDLTAEYVRINANYRT